MSDSQANWKRGDKVVRTGKSFPEYGIVEGNVYTVLDISYEEEAEYADIHLAEDTERWYDKRSFELYVQSEAETTDDLQSELTEALAKIDTLESALEEAVRELISLREGSNTAVINVNQDEGKPYDVIQFKPVEHYTLEDWKEAMRYGWKFKTRSGDVVLIEEINNEDDDNRPICDSNDYYHNINGMWDESVGEDIVDIIKRIK